MKSASVSTGIGPFIRYESTNRSHLRAQGPRMIWCSFLIQVRDTHRCFNAPLELFLTRIVHHRRGASLPMIP